MKQAYILEKITGEIINYINDYTAKAFSVEMITFCPKKDGDEKANFSQNFGVDGVVSIPSKSQYRKEQIKLVDIAMDLAPHYSSDAGTLRGVNFRVIIPDEYRDAARRVPESFMHTKHSVWLGSFKDEAPDMQALKGDAITARAVFDFIKGPYLTYLQKQVTAYKKDLERLPSEFCAAVSACNDFAASREGTRNVLSHYMYGMQGQNFSYMLGDVPTNADAMHVINGVLAKRPILEYKV